MGRRSNPKTVTPMGDVRKQYVVVWDEDTGLEVDGPFDTAVDAENHICDDSFRRNGSVVKLGNSRGRPFTQTRKPRLTHDQVRRAVGTLHYEIALSIIRGLELAEITGSEDDDG